jgi:phosphomannomutase
VISDQLKLEVQDWIRHDPDKKTADKLAKWLNESNEVELKRCFNGFLQFGTAGLRGALGPGPSCMNRAVVSRTATGIVAFMKKNNLNSVVIGRDARHGSQEFAQDSAEIFCGAGIKTFVLPRELPTPVLAYAVNKLKVDVGIMVTASHNPANDNGYKVYLGGSVKGINFNGSQIISPIDSDISHEISKADLAPPRSNDFKIVSENLIEDYVQATASLVTKPNNLKIVYTPLHGVGAEVFLRVLKAAKFLDPIVVEEQSKPDPDFPTTKFPNPEESGVMDLAIEYAKKFNAELVIANDPDADRCAISVKGSSGTWRMLKGDEIGVALGAYLIEKGSIRHGAIANSLVSSALLGKIAVSKNIRFSETLTGFKWISKVANLEYGYEEALGYCVDPKTVNDKDGISAAILIAELANKLKNNGKTLEDYLLEIGKEFGFHITDQISIRVSEIGRSKALMDQILGDPPSQILGCNLESIENLNEQKDLSTPGIRLKYSGGIRVIIRPSGTEPKLKCYIEVIGASNSDSEKLISQVRQVLIKVLT